MVYKPWCTYPSGKEWRNKFEFFIRSPTCPKSARLTYNRVMQRFYNNTEFVEPKSSPAPPAQQTIALEDQELLFLAGLNGNAIGINATDLDGTIIPNP